MMNTGNDTCEKLKALSFTGNVIPQIWYKVFVKKDLKHPKPHLLAINILADIVYWYRPVEIRDEGSGQLTGYRKKFRSDMLQRNYSQFSDFFGCSNCQAKDAIVFLESMGVIRRNFRTVHSGGLVLANTLFIELNVDMLKELTYPSESESDHPEGKSKPEAKEYNSGNAYKGVCGNFTGRVSENEVCGNLTKGSDENSQGGVAKFRRTYTENTTKTSTENPSIPSYSPCRRRMNDNTAKPGTENAGIEKIIKETGLGSIRHKKMIEPLRGIFCAIVRNNGSDAITGLTTADIDGVIDRFTEQSRLGRIMSPEEYLKASFLKAGRAAKINTLLTAETHNDKPSYDIDEYVRMSIERLHREE